MDQRNWDWVAREEWTWGIGTPPVVKVLVWFTDGSRIKEGTGAGIYGQSVGRRLTICLGRYATVFQAEIFAILACAHEVQLHGRPEQHISICSNGQATLNALQVARTTCALVQQCQKAVNDISTNGMQWGCIASLPWTCWVTR